MRKLEEIGNTKLSNKSNNLLRLWDKYRITEGKQNLTNLRIFARDSYFHETKGNTKIT